MLKDVPPHPFQVRVKLARHSKCTAPPIWLGGVLKSGASMELEHLLVQAGLHFADSLNPDVMPGSGDARQKATELAWYLISMLKPEVDNNQLYVHPPNDKDIQRLASEILGVGAGLEFLRLHSPLDSRTFVKLSSRFDFEGRTTGGVASTKIELKGTVNGASTGVHRKRIKAKLNEVTVRDYDNALGLIFSSWAKGAKRTFDIEIMDPPGAPAPNREKAIREVIRHYARRYDQNIQLARGAKFLWDLAAQASIESIGDLTHWLGRIPRSSHVERLFNRSSLRLQLQGSDVEFWGGYWDGASVAPPLPHLGFARYPIGYVGVDSAVIKLLREKKFDEFLSFSRVSGVYKFDALDQVAGAPTSDGPAPVQQRIAGILITEYDGTARAWLSHLPQGTLVVEEATGA